MRTPSDLIDEKWTEWNVPNENERHYEQISEQARKRENEALRRVEANKSHKNNCVLKHRYRGNINIKTICQYM